MTCTNLRLDNKRAGISPGSGAADQPGAAPETIPDATIIAGSNKAATASG